MNRDVGYMAGMYSGSISKYLDPFRGKTVYYKMCEDKHYSYWIKVFYDD